MVNVSGADDTRVGTTRDWQGAARGPTYPLQRYGLTLSFIRPRVLCPATFLLLGFALVRC